MRLSCLLAKKDNGLLYRRYCYLNNINGTQSNFSQLCSTCRTWKNGAADEIDTGVKTKSSDFNLIEIQKLVRAKINIFMGPDVKRLHCLTLQNYKYTKFNNS